MLLLITCKQGIKGVDFIVCNTDSELQNSSVPNKIQLV
jgi:cell division protein FtsZ